MNNVFDTMSTQFSLFLGYLDVLLIQPVYDASAWVLPVVMAIVLHEVSHGFVAYFFGDNTARDAGRLSLNPMRHVDRFGTVILPALLLLAKSPFIFGYAKPVPVNFHALSRPRLGMFLVAAAGPTSNILLMMITAMFLRADWFFSPETTPWLHMNLYRFMFVNAVLAVFNLLPLLPLDGGRMVAALLPEPLAHHWARLERPGLLLIFIIFIGSGVLDMYFGTDLRLGERLIEIPAQGLTQRIMGI